MKVAMKQFGTVTALSLLLLTGAAFAQDEAAVTEETSEEAVAEEEGGWFSGITGWFSGLFGGSDDEPEESVASDAAADEPAAPGGTDWYGGAGLGVAKYEENGLSTSTAFNVYGGAILSNRIGFEAGFSDLGDSDIKGTSSKLATDGFRGLVTFSSAADVADTPVRLGLGYYSFDAAVGSVSDSSSGLTAAVNFEKAMTERLFLSLGVDFYFGAKAFGVRSDVLVFGLGLAFHTSPPGAVVAEADAESVEVGEPAAEVPAEEPAVAAEPAPVEAAPTPAEEPAVEEPAVEEPAADPAG